MQITQRYVAEILSQNQKTRGYAKKYGNFPIENFAV